MNLIKKIDEIVNSVLEVICIAVLVVLFLLLVLNVFFRFVPLYSMGWFDEIVELAFTSLTFFGAAYLWRHKEHSRIDFIQEKFENTKVEFILELFITLIGMIFVVVFFKYSVALIGKTTAWSPIFKIPRKVFYVSMPISAIFMGIYSIRDLIYYTRQVFTDNKTKERIV